MSKYIEFYQTPISVLDLRFLKIDASNDPITGDLTINANLLFDGTRKIIGGTTTTSDFTLQTTSGVGVTGADMHFLVGNNGGTEAMTILNNGNVGVGTASPAYKLDVTDSVAGGQVVIRARNTSTSGGNTTGSIFIANSSYYGQLFKAGTGYTSYKTVSANDTGFYNQGAGNISILNDVGDIRFTSNGATSVHMIVASSGNVGIGSICPPP